MNRLDLSTHLLKARDWLATRVQGVVSLCKDEINNISQDNNTPEHQTKLAEALEILNQLSTDYINNRRTQEYIDIRELLERKSDCGLSEAEKIVLATYENAVSLLKEAKELGSTYAICLLALLKMRKGDTICLRPIREKNIEEQESQNWYALVAAGNHTHEIREAAEKGNMYAQFQIGKILIKQGKIVKKEGDIGKGISYLKKSLLQGYKNPTYELAKYYYEEEDEKYKKYLEDGLRNGNGDCFNLQGEILWKGGEREKAIECFKVGYQALKHHRCFINYMTHSNDAKQRDEFLCQYIEGDDMCEHLLLGDKEQLLSVEPQYIKGSGYLKDKVYTELVKQILDQIQEKTGISIDIDTILSCLYVKRKLSPDENKIYLGLYENMTENDDSTGANIGIDVFLHIAGIVRGDTQVLPIAKHVICHEIIHKISREAGATFSLPRFFNEGITTYIEQEIIGKESLGYHSETAIFQKFLKLSGKKKEDIFKHFLGGKTWYIKNLLDTHIDSLIDFSKKQRLEDDIITEMRKYKAGIPTI